MYALADYLKVPLSVIGKMTTVEFEGWLIYRQVQNEKRRREETA